MLVVRHRLWRRVAELVRRPVSTQGHRVRPHPGLGDDTAGAIEALRRVPPDIVGVLSYFNVPVETDPGGKENPLRIMLDLCTPADFIVIKIDIDNAPLEHAFIDQIIQNPRLHGLIDELFFEHHVERSPMEFRGWHETVRKGVDPTAHRFTDLQDPPAPPGAEYVRGNVTKDNGITASYAIFNILRELGIRAHSWV